MWAQPLSCKDARNDPLLAAVSCRNKRLTLLHYQAWLTRPLVFSQPLYSRYRGVLSAPFIDGCRSHDMWQYFVSMTVDSKSQYFVSWLLIVKVSTVKCRQLLIAPAVRDVHACTICDRRSSSAALWLGLSSHQAAYHLSLPAMAGNLWYPVRLVETLAEPHYTCSCPQSHLLQQAEYGMWSHRLLRLVLSELGPLSSELRLFTAPWIGTGIKRAYIIKIYN